MFVRLSMLLEIYTKTAPFCLGLLVFFAIVALLAWFLTWKRLDFDLSARKVFWCCMTPGFLLAAACLTLIDEPYWQVSQETKNWMFMFSAFLGIPAVLPLFAGAVLASVSRVAQIQVRTAHLTLVMLGTFALGCAASNIHDVVWCAAITDSYAHHHVAGGDLYYFVALGSKFGVASEVLSDYATLGLCALVMVVGELTVAVACFGRLARLSRLSG